MVKASDLVAGFQQSLDEQWGYILGKTHEMWSEQKQADYVKAHSGNDKYQMSCEYGGKWVGHWVTDCSGLVTYWMKHYGGTMYHGSNTMFLKWCSSKGELQNGKRTDGQPLKPGTAVFCLRESDGVYSHVGLYVGGGWVIEAAGTKQGVIRSKVTDKKWEFWGELKGVDYDTSDTASPDPIPSPSLPTLRRGSKGDDVRRLQQELQALGYDLGSYGVDGSFGKATENAVKAFQKAFGLAVDGIVGKNTWAALQAAKSPEKRYTMTIAGLTKDQACQLLKEYPEANVEEEVV